MSSFLEDIYILSNIKRYSTIHTIRQESVAEHSFFVAAILFELHGRYGFDLGRAISMAIAHDMPELELNDVPRSIKQKYPKIAEAFKECEKDVINTLPSPIKICLREYEMRATIESKMVKLADTMQCRQYAQSEMKLGNGGYLEGVYHASLKRIDKLERELERYKR